MTLKMNVIYCKWHYYMCHVMGILLYVAMTEKKKKEEKLCLCMPETGQALFAKDKTNTG